MTLYGLKPRFQALLRPLVARLAAAGITANQVTISAAVISCIVGGGLAWCSATALYLLLPVWLFLRMAMNAVDGMLAREFGQKSRLGAYLNELCDVIADAALALPFAVIPPFTPASVFVVILLAALAEYAGVMGPLVGAGRRYDGPLGKSDRAFVFGALGAWVGLFGTLPDWGYWLMPLLSLLLVFTIINRVRRGLAEAGH